MSLKHSEGFEDRVGSYYPTISGLIKYFKHSLVNSESFLGKKGAVEKNEQPATINLTRIYSLCQEKSGELATYIANNPLNSFRRGAIIGAIAAAGIFGSEALNEPQPVFKNPFIAPSPLESASIAGSLLAASLFLIGRDKSLANLDRKLPHFRISKKLEV